MRYRVTLESIEEEFKVEEIEQLLYETCVTDFLRIEEVEEIDEF